MNQSENNEFREFLKSFPRTEIVNTLNKIDDKISSLHTISSKDFLYFNKLLKQYYSNIKDISQANNEISNFINIYIPNIKTEIKEKIKTQLQLLSDTHIKVQKIQDYLSKIYSSLDLIIVPFNNYKQNLITLKYILANLNLHLNYIELNNNDVLKQSVGIIEQSIDKVQTQIEYIDTEINGVSELILRLKNNPCIGENIDDSMLRDELSKVSLSLKKISANNFLPESAVMELNIHTQKCFSHMGEIITNIQYHDIIRQKMEHIQISQSDLINEINDIETITQNKQNQLNLIMKIPEITDIQVAQLLYTNKDYQTSIEKITSQLIDVGTQMKSLSNIYKKLNDDTYDFEESFINKLTLSQSIFEQHFNKLSTNWEESTLQSTELYASYKKLKNEFNTIFIDEKSLRKDVKDFEKLLKENGSNFANDLTRRLNNLFSDLQINSNSLKANLNNITQILVFLSSLTNTLELEPSNYYFGNNLLSDISETSKKFKKNTKEYTGISIAISNEITQSIKKIEYYVFFKNTVEEIVSLLKHITQIVNYDKLKDIFGEDNEYLQKIEQLYTMKSERDIHSKMVDSGKSASELINEETEDIFNIDDNDIELF